MKINAKELRTKYSEFFKSKGHAIIPSSSVIPENDPTVLFTTAGMHPLVPFLLGQSHPLGKRLVNVQKCIRTDDIDEVGDAFHHTFFEMLGNWSLGDYFKEGAIQMSFEFLTKILKLEKEKLAVTCFKGDNDAPKDNESAKVWESLGIPKHKISFLPKKQNWWGPAGESGPCGPDTEMFFYIGKDKPKESSNAGDNESEWVEIWNDVFMQYNKTKEGKFIPLAQKNVDTGMGLERTLAVLNGFEDNYKTELFLPIIEQIEKLSKKTYDKNKKEMRIIADHLRASVFILGDNKQISPSNVEQGYILRRLIRRAIRTAKILEINQDIIKQIAETIIKIYKDPYTELEKNKSRILEELEKEEQRFKQTLEIGLKHFSKLVQLSARPSQQSEKGRSKGETNIISGKDAFLLFQSYGFPIEMTVELAKENKLKVDESAFYKEYEMHQQLSRQGAEKKFSSGLADTSIETTKLHTATHLLQSALREVLGVEVHQKGSNITSERLRFDFNYNAKLTPEQLKKVEDKVNEAIKKAIDVKRDEMFPEEAKKSGATGLFGEKYGEKVSVYTIGHVSKEICTGPHVTNTKELKHFKILKEESVAAGIRRIKAVVE